MKDLFEKYDVPAPRYTSYPTVPYWSNVPTSQDWLNSLANHFRQANGWSIYIHVPYCESLCTFCGCNTSITRDHKHEAPYVDQVIKEFSLYYDQFAKYMAEVPLRQIHLGGGSPTFLSAPQMRRLVESISKSVKIDLTQFEGSIEVDPRTTKDGQLETLAELGFNRISLGVQDFDPKVQEIVNRFQPYEMTKKVTEDARKIGYQSVNYDLIYGLPLQNATSIKELAEKTVELRPDRIALYSFALVPWIKPQQRKFKDEDVPHGKEKRDLYEISREILINSGYKEIGMDHFALPTDALWKAAESKTLHRNFMGYSDQRTEIMLGLGVSSISETPDCFHQNEKRLPVYKRCIEQSQLPTLRGHMLDEEDISQRRKIMEFMTELKVELPGEELLEVENYLRQMKSDDLVRFDKNHMYLTEQGKPFLRNACMALDKRLRNSAPDRQVFSKSM